MADINLTSPEAVLMLPIAILLDGTMLTIGLLGDWWGFSDYGTIGVLGWMIIGAWAYIRKGGIAEQIREESAQEEVEPQKIVDGTQSRGPQKAEDISNFAKKKNRQNKAMTDNPKNKQSITNVKAKVKKKIGKVLKKYGFGFIVKGIPIVGDFWPGFTIFVIRELRN